MAFLEIERLTRTFSAQSGVRDVSFSAGKGEFVSLLGPSGCGKTTVLRAVAGFERPTSGVIRIAGRDVTALSPRERAVGMVFQAYALFPNLTVAENIAFGLKVAKRPAAEVKSRVDEMLALIKLPAYAGRYPTQLSGGQQQRVALARALAVRPNILLLDEPLSALDAKIRVSLREEIRAVQRDLGITTLFVTHDQEEALAMSDRIVVMNEGRIEQIGTPFEIYNMPSSRFVSAFVGHINTLSGTVTDAGTGRISVAGQSIHLAGPVALAAGGPCQLALRPEAVAVRPVREQAHDQEPDDAVRNLLRGEICEVGFLGSIVRMKASIGGEIIAIDMFNKAGSPPPLPGDMVDLSFARADIRIVP